VGVPYCRPGIHGVAPTVRQQGTPTRGSRCTNHSWSHFSKGPGVQIIPGRHSGFALPKRSLTSASPFRFLVVQMISSSPCAWKNQARDFIPLPSATSAGGFLWVESHSDAVATWSWAWRSGKNGKLSEDIPARSFCRSAQPCPTPCQTWQRVRPTGTPRHGSFYTPVPAGMDLLIRRARPARVF
jgi:hypothetical protein